MWFAVAGGAVLAAGWALLTGRRWGRGLAVFAELLLLPVAWYLTVGSHRALFGVPVAARGVDGVGAVVQSGDVALVLRRDQPGPASSANSGPDSR